MKSYIYSIILISTLASQYSMAADISLKSICGDLELAQCSTLLGNIKGEVDKAAKGPTVSGFSELFLSKTSLSGKYGVTNTTDAKSGDSGLSLGKDIKETDAWEVKLATELPLSDLFNSFTEKTNAPKQLQGFALEANYSYGTATDDKRTFDAFNNGTSSAPETKETDKYYIGIKYKRTLADLFN